MRINNFLFDENLQFATCKTIYRFYSDSVFFVQLFFKLENVKEEKVIKDCD